MSSLKQKKSYFLVLELDFWECTLTYFERQGRGLEMLSLPGSGSVSYVFWLDGRLTAKF